MGRPTRESYIVGVASKTTPPLGPPKSVHFCSGGYGAICSSWPICRTLRPGPPPPSVGFPDTGKRQQKNGEIKFELLKTFTFYRFYLLIMYL